MDLKGSFLRGEGLAIAVRVHGVPDNDVVKFSNVEQRRKWSASIHPYIAKGQIKTQHLAEQSP